MQAGGQTIQTAPYPAPGLERPLVIPQHVFAASRERFECVVRRNFSSHAKVIAAIFDAIPLEEHGWDRSRTKVTHIGNTEYQFPIWRVERL